MSDRVLNTPTSGAEIFENKSFCKFWELWPNSWRFMTPKVFLSPFAKVYVRKTFPIFFFFFSQAFSPKKLSLFWKCFPFWKDKVEDNFTILFSFLVLCFLKVKKIFMKVYARKKKLFWPICKSLCSQNANISQTFLSRQSFFF